MHRWIRLAGVVTLAISAQAIGQALAPNDAVTVDADVHRVVLENEYIRVFDARASKGAKSPMHSHPPFVLVSLGSTRFRMTLPDGKTSLLDLNPGQAAWVEGAQHSWELLAGELRVIGVEIKSAQKQGAPQPAPVRPADDTGTAGPRCPPCALRGAAASSRGERRDRPEEPDARSPTDRSVSLDWIRLKLTQPDGKTAIHDFSPTRCCRSVEGATHFQEAIAGGGRVIAIEVKAAAQAAGS